MLQITDTAGKYMQAALVEAGADVHECFRVVVAEEGVSLTRDQQRPNDVALEHEDQVVLVLDGPTAELLKDRKIDYDEATSGLVFA